MLTFFIEFPTVLCAQSLAAAAAPEQQQHHPCYVYMFSHRGEASLPQLMMPQLSDNKRDLGVSHFDEVLLQFTNKVCMYLSRDHLLCLYRSTGVQAHDWYDENFNRLKVVFSKPSGASTRFGKYTFSKYQSLTVYTSFPALNFQMNCCTVIG